MAGDVWIVLRYDPEEVEAAKADGTLHEFSGIHGVSAHSSGQAATAAAKRLQAEGVAHVCASKMSDERKGKA